MYELPGGVATQCNILTGSNTIWNCIVTDPKKQYYHVLNFIGR